MSVPFGGIPSREIRGDLYIPASYLLFVGGRIGDFCGPCPFRMMLDVRGHLGIPILSRYVLVSLFLDHCSYPESHVSSQTDT